MVKGHEWSYVEEVVAGKTASRLRCRACAHIFSGNASRIKEHLFKVPGNVAPCKQPPREIYEKFPEYARKAKAIIASKGKGAPKGLSASLATEVEATLVRNEESQTVRNHSSQTVGQNTVHLVGATGSTHASPSTSVFPNGSTGVSASGGAQTLHHAFDKQWLLELHLKWTQAFVACGIPFNVLRNPIFKDALMSTAKKGFVMPDYNEMRTEYVGKVKDSCEAILKRTVLDFVPVYGCTIALDGWTNCQKKPLINVMLICPRGSIFLETIDTSLKEKTSTFLAKIYERAISKAGGP